MSFIYCLLKYRFFGSVCCAPFPAQITTQKHTENRIPIPRSRDQAGMPTPYILFIIFDKTLKSKKGQRQKVCVSLYLNVCQGTWKVTFNIIAQISCQSYFNSFVHIHYQLMTQFD